MMTRVNVSCDVDRTLSVPRQGLAAHMVIRNVQASNEPCHMNALVQKQQQVSRVAVCVCVCVCVPYQVVPDLAGTLMMVSPSR
jgi:hypothetical protein